MTSVLQVVATANRRGAEVFAVDLGLAMAERGLKVDTVALVPGDGGMDLDVPVLGERRLAPVTLRHLRAEIRRHHIVIGHGSSSLPTAAIAGIGTHVPFVYRSIGDPRYWARSQWARWRVGALLGRTAAVVALTEGAADAIADAYGVSRGKLHVIPKGIPSERFPLVDDGRRAMARDKYALDGSRPVIAYIGALTAEKNVALAVRAVSLVPDTLLLVAGDGPDRHGLEQLADRIAPGRVRFLGSVSGPATVLAASDVLVLSSDTEGLPGVLMEAGLSGIPAVTTNVGWVRDVVLDGVTGFVVPARDAAALADGLRRALDDAGALGVAARRHCQSNFEIGAIGDRWAALVGAVAR